MIHDKILYHHCNIWHLCDPIALYISYDIRLRVLATQIFLRVRLRVCITHGVQKMWGYLPSIIAPAHLHAEALSVMIWMTFLRSNLFDAIFKLGCNEFLALFFSLGIHGVQEHHATFGDRHEINDGSPLRIRPSITTNGYPFSFQVPLIGSNLSM